MRRILLIACAGIMLGAAPRFAGAGSVTGIDVMTSTVMQENQSSFSGVAVRAQMVSERLVPGIEFLPSVEYWRNRSTVPSYGIEAVRRDATLGIDARYMFRAEGWSPYAGAGFGLHFLQQEVDAPTLGLNNERESLVKGGLSVLAGANFPITDRIQNFVELKFHNVTDYRQLKFNWGLTFML